MTESESKNLRSMINENQRLVPDMRTLWDLEQRFYRAGAGFLETADNLMKDIRVRTGEALKRGEERRRQVSAASLEEYQQLVRETFFKGIGGLPGSEEPLNGRVLSCQKYDSFILEKVIFESRPRVYVTGNLYRPLHRSEPGPAVLIMVGHCEEGKAFGEYQRLAQMLVYAGFVVLIQDPVGQGERRDHYERELELQPICGCSGEHDLLDWKCRLLGLSLARYFAHDGIRGLDYLASRPEVDPSRIAVTGHSGGGTQTYLLMVAAADRLAAAAPCSFTTDIAAMVELGKDQDNEQIWAGTLEAGLDYVDFLGMMAPKPVMILANQYDFFPIEGAERTLERARRLWKQTGSPNEPELAVSVSGHAYTGELAEAVTGFFSRHLMGKKADLSSFRFRQLPERELWCTPQGVVLKEYPDARTVQTELLEEYQRLVSAREALAPAERRAAGQRWLWDTVAKGRRKTEPHVRVYGEGICGHYVYRALVWRVPHPPYSGA